MNHLLCRIAHDWQSEGRFANKKLVNITRWVIFVKTNPLYNDCIVDLLFFDSKG